jgi:hypothetical protein
VSNLSGWVVPLHHPTNQEVAMGVRRIALGLLASGVLLFVTGAAGMVAAWSVAVGAVLLVAAAMAMAVALEARDLDPAA